MRRQGWDRLLREFVRERRAIPFVWGRNDCVTLAADWIERCCENPPVSLEVTWSDAASAAREIAARGGLIAATTEILGEPISRKLAQRGDVVLVEQNGREMLSVCVGDHVLLPGESGGVLHPIEDAVLAWRVG